MVGACSRQLVASEASEFPRVRDGRSSDGALSEQAQARRREGANLGGTVVKETVENGLCRPARDVPPEVIEQKGEVGDLTGYTRLPDPRHNSRLRTKRRRDARSVGRQRTVEKNRTSRVAKLKAPHVGDDRLRPRRQVVGEQVERQGAGEARPPGPRYLDGAESHVGAGRSQNLAGVNVLDCDANDAASAGGMVRAGHGGTSPNRTPANMVRGAGRRKGTASPGQEWGGTRGVFGVADTHGAKLLIPSSVDARFRVSLGPA